VYAESAFLTADCGFQEVIRMAVCRLGHSLLQAACSNGRMAGFGVRARQS